MIHLKLTTLFMKEFQLVQFMIQVLNIINTIKQQTLIQDIQNITIQIGIMIINLRKQQYFVLEKLVLLPLQMENI